ncbi:alpha/beta-hydrolase [Trichodelitschia bisporula]|uniref:Carboxypeptidase n=1 Tax=Trichodelitschia bisporula TaxID=703511 RepID=A0A6G1HLM6_9PEZI|nr:alpha/beta-hydrolase [Trichodelitschia bisporula]
MLRFLSLSVVCLLFLLCCDAVSGRETSDERARAVRARRAAMANSRPKAAKAPRQAPAMRFLSDNTKGFFVNSLPNVPYDLGELYSGQLPVGNDTSRNMFFAFQPTVGAPVDELVVWFNGGPGCSSLEAFFQENGLISWQWGQTTPVINQYSWVNLTNVLWVEYPIGLGFSTGAVTATSEEETAADFLAFFRNFQDTFGISGLKTFIAGESYAGRYVPYVADALLSAPDADRFNVSGALMYDPVIGQYEYIGQTVAAVPFIEKHALLFNFNATFMEQLKREHEYCGYANYTDTFLTFPPLGQQPEIVRPFAEPGSGVNCDVWGKAYMAAYQPNPCFNVYEINSMCPLLGDPLGFPTDLQYQYPGTGGVYFDRPDVKAAMHAPPNVSWSECSGPVFANKAGQYRNGDLSADPIQSVLPRLIEATNRVLIANGDFDFEILTDGTLLSIQNMTWGGKMGFQTAPATPIDIRLPDLQYGAVFEASGLGGYDGGDQGQGVMGVQHFERGLMWAETFQSGHMQPQFQPRSSYRHLQWVLGRIEEL